MCEYKAYSVLFRNGRRRFILINFPFFLPHDCNFPCPPPSSLAMFIPTTGPQSRRVFKMSLRLPPPPLLCSWPCRPFSTSVCQRRTFLGRFGLSLPLARVHPHGHKCTSVRKQEDAKKTGKKVKSNGPSRFSILFWRMTWFTIIHPSAVVERIFKPHYFWPHSSRRLWNASATSNVY